MRLPRRVLNPRHRRRLVAPGLAPEPRQVVAAPRRLADRGGWFVSHVLLHVCAPVLKAAPGNPACRRSCKPRAGQKMRHFRTLVDCSGQRNGHAAGYADPFLPGTVGAERRESCTNPRSNRLSEEGQGRCPWTPLGP